MITQSKKGGADYIFQTDADGQTDPNDFNIFWEHRKKYDGIFGNRVQREDGKIRIFIEKIVCILLKLYFNVNIPDANAPFRLMNADVLKKYLYMLPSDFNIPNIMLTAYFSYYEERIIFFPITFHARQNGTNSVNIKKIFKIGLKALSNFHILRKEMKNKLP